MLSTLRRTKEYFIPPQPPQPEAPAFTLESAAAAVRATDVAATNRDSALAVLEKDQLALAAAIAKRDDSLSRRIAAERELRNAEEKSRSAKAFLTRQSVKDPQEDQHHELGLAAMKRAGQLAARSGFSSLRIAPPGDVAVASPEETVHGKRLAAVLKEIADCEEFIRRHPGAARGTTGADRRLRKLLPERDELQETVERHRQRYAQWQEIEAIRREADEHFAERDRLRKEREDAAIEAALTSAK